MIKVRQTAGFFFCKKWITATGTRVAEGKRWLKLSAFWLTATQTEVFVYSYSERRKNESQQQERESWKERNASNQPFYGLQQHERKFLQIFIANLMFRFGKNRVDFLSSHVIIKTLSVVAFYLYCLLLPTNCNDLNTQQQEREPQKGRGVPKLSTCRFTATQTEVFDTSASRTKAAEMRITATCTQVLCKTR